MESNEQTELTSKIETDSWMENRITALGGRVGVEGWSQKRKGMHGQQQQRGDCEQGVVGSGWRHKRGDKGDKW